MIINEIQNNIVDNFSFVEKYIREHNEKDEWGDNFYYVTIQQRKKDNDEHALQIKIQHFEEKVVFLESEKLLIVVR